MSRLESGSVQVTKEWQPLEEVVGTTLLRLEKSLTDYPVKTNLAENLPLVPIDGILIEQVLVNLLENVFKYTPPHTEIELSARYNGKEVLVTVADHGPGLPVGDEERIFDKFYRAGPSSAGGVGLGLAICRAIVEAHGGRIWATNRTGGGAVFTLTLPLDGEPPLVPTDEDIESSIESGTEKSKENGIGRGTLQERAGEGKNGTDYPISDTAIEQSANAQNVSRQS